MNSLLGRIGQILLRPSIASYKLFICRTYLSRFETIYSYFSRLMAISEACRAQNRVPAYKEFLISKNISNSQFSELPETSKENYILPSLKRSLEELYINSKVPCGSIRDTSTGTSGKATAWYRGVSESQASRKILGYRARAILNGEEYYFINGFALGPWATGIATALGVSADSKAILSNIGPNIEEILSTIKEATSSDPKRPIIVAGYPPHMQELVELAQECSFPLHDYNILAVVGGEPIAEAQRDSILSNSKTGKTGVSKVYSYYGASDLDINIGFETDFEVDLRRELMSNSELAQDVFGDHPFIPMIFHYDPLSYYIEENSEGSLIYTNVVGDRISPRIRYNLGDKGQIMSISRIKKILEKHNINLGSKPNTHLPLLFVWGRVDSYITYRGANLSPENIGESLQRLGHSNVVKNFAFWQFEESAKIKTEILLEICDKQNIKKSYKNLTNELINELRSINIDFDEQVKKSPLESLPKLRVLTGDSPMAKHRRDNPSRKRKYIFMGSEIQNISGELIDYHLGM
jgi:phenylacetate-CoA ligase